MKNTTGLIIGFIVGMAGFLLLFRILVLDRITPEDELAPGIVMLIAICCGVVLAIVGRRITQRLA